MVPLCDECSGTYAGASGLCGRCGASADSCFKLCDSCAIQADECQGCGKKLQSGYSQADLVAIAAGISERDLAVKTAEATYRAAVAPIQDAVTAFTKADEEAYAAYKAVTAEVDAVCAAANQAFQKAWQAKEGVDAARKAKQDVDDAATPVRAAAHKVHEQRREEIDAEYGEQRKIYDDARQTSLNAKHKAEKKCDLTLSFIAGRHRLEVGYKMELQRLEEQG